MGPDDRSSADPAAVVAGFVAAWERNDPDAIVACFADDARWYDGYPAGLTTGAVEIRAQLDRYSRHITDVSIEVLRQAVDGEWVFQERVDRGRRDGVDFEVAAVCVFRVVGGRIVENRDYWNPGAYRRRRDDEGAS
jgi:limonene-1,2-epoxide hydrolase